jgi:hypothetical protein
MMHGHEKSRFAIVAVKPTNKAERSAERKSRCRLKLARIRCAVARLPAIEATKLL